MGPVTSADAAPEVPVYDDAPLAFRDAVRRALTNPALMAEGEKTQRFVAYQAPDKAVEITRKVLNAATPEQKKRSRCTFAGFGVYSRFKVRRSSR